MSVTNPQVLDSAGRIFQNPLDRHEIWVNIGRYEEHHTTLFTYHRIYPEYDPRLSPYISKQDYQNLLEFLKERVERAPCLSEACTQFLCVCTCALCFCPYVYIHHEIKTLKTKMVQAFETQQITNAVEVRLRVVDNDEAQGATMTTESQQHQNIQSQKEKLQQQPTKWYDSLGRILELEEKAKKKCYKYPAYIPPGINLILTLPDIVSWPGQNDDSPPVENFQVVDHEPSSATLPLIPN